MNNDKAGSNSDIESELLSTFQFFRIFRLLVLCVFGTMYLVVVVDLAITHRSVGFILIMSIGILWVYALGYCFMLVYMAIRINSILVRLSRQGVPLQSDELRSAVLRHVRRTRIIHHVLCRVRTESLDAVLKRV